MLPKISLKKLMILSLGVLIIGALTNCGGGGGEGESDAATTKEPVEKAPDPEKEDPEKEDPDSVKCTADQSFINGECVNNTVFTYPAVIAAASSCEGDLALEVTLNEEMKCFNAEKQVIDFVLTSTAEGSARSWPNTDVRVDLAVNDATLAVKNCYVNEVVQDRYSSFKANFSSHFSCDVLVRSIADDNQHTYKINIVHGISEADDFRSDFFAKAAARFVLTSNIQLPPAETAFFAPSFKGQLDGSNHEINGLSIDAAETDSSDNIGLISQVRLSADDPMVEIKNLALGISKLVGSRNVGGLIGWVDSSPAAKAVQIKDVTVKFTDFAELKCTRNCGGLVGSADSSVHFSDIEVKGDVSAAGNTFGGVIGRANAMQLTDVTADFTINHSDGDYIGLTAGRALHSILKNIDVSGAINCGSSCTNVGGVVGYLTSSQLSRVKSSLQFAATAAKSASIGGVIGSTFDSMLASVYGTLTAQTALTSGFGSISGVVRGGSLERAVGYLDVTASNEVSSTGGLIGITGNKVALKQVFAAGKLNADSVVKSGQVIGHVQHGGLFVAHSYSGVFTGSNLPTEAVSFAENVAYSSFTRCYTHADIFASKFVSSEGAYLVTFDTVYAKTAQKVGGGVLVKGLPKTFEASKLNETYGIIWTNEYDGKEYTYPMLIYQVEEGMGPISEADWFKHQIENNPEVQVDSNPEQ